MNLSAAAVALGIGCVAYVVGSSSHDQVWRWSWWAFGWFAAAALTMYCPALMVVALWEALQQPS